MSPPALPSSTDLGAISRRSPDERSEIRERPAGFNALVPDFAALIPATCFDREAAAMRQELEEAFAVLTTLDAFTKLARGGSDTLN